MSQAGILDVEKSNPQIPTSFTTNFGIAVPIANNLEILGAVAPQGTDPVFTSASGNTVTVNVQIANEVATSDATVIGLAAFDSASFDVDANGFVTLTGGGGPAVTDMIVDTSTPPGTNPVVPLSGDVTFTGAQVSSGTVGANVIRTNSLAANSITWQVQQSGSAAAQNTALNGVSHFNSTQFTVVNGFVSLFGGGAAIDSIAVQTGTSPVVGDGAGLVTFNGAVVAAGTNPFRTNGTGANTIAFQIQTSQALAATDATKIGLSNFNSAHFSVDANGFVSLLGGGEAIDSFTTDTSGPVVPAANGNVAFTGATNIFSDGSVANTMRLNLQGTNHALFVGRGATTASANIATGTSGQIMQSAGASTDPGWTTSTYPSTNAINTLLYASAANTMTALAASNNGVLISSATGVPSWLAAGTTGQVLTATTGSPATWATPATKIGTINGDSGSITGATVTIFANRTSNATGRTVAFINSGTTSTLTLTDASDNILIGRVSGNATLSGSSNLGIGAGSLNALTSGGQNIALGQSSQTAMTSGVQNISIGYTSLTSNQTGNGSIAIGFECLNAYTGAGSCTAIGWRCLNNSVSGSFNIGLGIGSGNAYIGAETSNIVIANTGVAAESNTLRLGTQGTGSGQVNRAFVAGIVGVTTSNSQMVTIDSTTGQLGVATITTGTVTAVTGTANRITSTGGATPQIDISASYVGQSSITTLGTVTTGVWNGTTIAIANGGTNATSMATTNGIVKYDGTRLVTSSTAKIDSNNRMTNGSQPCFLYYCNAVVTNVSGDGTNYTCLFQTQVFDNGPNFSSNTTFTAPVTGMYQFNISVLTQNNLAAHNPNFKLVVNGSTNYTFGNFGGSFVGNFPLHSSIVIAMNATDTCTVVLQTSNSTKTVGVYGAAGDCRTYFSGYLVC